MQGRQDQQATILSVSAVEPNFCRGVCSSKNLLIDEALESLKTSVNKAVVALTGLLNTKNESLRRAVCNDVMGHIYKIRELQEVEARLTRLEQLLGDRR